MKKVFFFLFFTSLLMANLSALTYVDNCTDLNITGETYMLSADIYSLSPIRSNCFDVTAENVTLDGNGYTLYGDGAGKGVYSNQDGTIIQNFKSLGAFTFEPTIYFENVSNGKIVFSNISASSVIDNPIVLTGSSGNNISYNRLISAGIVSVPLYLHSNSDNNFISNNLITASGGSSESVILSSSSNNYFLQNNVTNSLGDYAVYLTSSSENNTFEENIVIELGDGRDAFFIESASSFNNFISNNITAEGTGLVILQSEDCNVSLNTIEADAGIVSENANNLFVQENDISGVTWDVYFYLETMGITLLNQDVSTYTISEIDNLIVKNSYGQIVYNESITATGTDLSADILILNNSVYTNADSGINQSAIIDLYDLEYFNSPILLRNGVPCPSEICSNLTIVGNDYSFFVTGWSNYSIGENITEIPEENETQEEFSNGQVIYNTLNSSGAGLGIFFQMLAISLPFLLIGLVLTLIFIKFGDALKNSIFRPLE